MIPDVSNNPRKVDATAAYYAAFKRRHGFADSEMRGRYATERVITVPPIGDYDPDKIAADKFTAAPDRPERPLSARPRIEAVAARTMERAVGTTALLNSLRSLVGCLRHRVDGSAAIRDAMADAENVLRGIDPVAKGSDLADVLRSLVRVLSRHA